MKLELELPEETVRKLRALGALTAHKLDVGKLLENRIDTMITEMIAEELNLNIGGLGDLTKVPFPVEDDVVDEGVEKDIYEQSMDADNPMMGGEITGGELADVTMDDLDYNLESTEEKPHGPTGSAEPMLFSDPESFGDDAPRADGREEDGLDVLPVDYGLASIKGSNEAMQFFTNSMEGAVGDKSRRNTGIKY